MTLTKEKIKELKDSESEIDNAWDYERLVEVMNLSLSKFFK